MVNIYIGGDKVDQFKDEPVEVVSSVLDVSDITKNTGDYTKSFTVPASRNNNKLFKHWYNANIDGGFDSRTKVEGSIDIDGIPFKLGKFRLSKVSIEKNRPVNYTINFFGNIVDIKDTIGADELKDLRFTGYNHAFNSTNVSLGLSSSGLFGRLIVYTLMSEKRYFYNGNVAAGDFDEKQINIANGGIGTGVVWSDLRPSIKLSAIITAIETKYATRKTPIKFSSDFFGTTEFQQLYLWLNPSKDISPGGDPQTIDWDGGDSTWMNLTTNIGSYQTNTGNPQTYFQLRLEIVPEAGYTDVPYTVGLVNNGEPFFDSEEYTGTYNSGNFQITSINSSADLYNLSFNVKSIREFKYTATLVQAEIVSENVGGVIVTTTTTETTTASLKTTQSIVIVKDQMPDLKIIDFLKGLFNMFKLVVIPQDDGTLYVNTLQSYYNQGKRYDISNYVDRSKLEVERGEILNEIDLKFAESDTILASQFRSNNNRGYGDSLVRIRDEDGELIDGESLEFEIPFEQFVYERLIDINDNLSTNISTATIADDQINPVSTGAHIHYVSVQPLVGKTFAYVDDLGIRNEFTNPINIPMHHYTSRNPLYSIVFESEFSNWDKVAIENTLYKNHYEDYIQSIFNIKRRTFNYKAVVPVNMITDIALNSVITIDNNDYRINSYTYNLLSGVTNFELINGFDNVLGDGFFIPDVIPLDNNAHELVFNVPNAEDYTIALNTNGWGTDWATVVGSGNTITFNVDESIIDFRTMDIIFTLGVKSISILLKQSGFVVTTSDNNIITVDNNIKTVDNG